MLGRRLGANAMARPLRLAVILLLMCAGIVVAAPVATSPDRAQPLTIAKPLSKPVRNDVVLEVDQKSGCVWRVSLATGRRERESFLCKRSTKGLKRTEPVSADPPAKIVHELGAPAEIRAPARWKVR